MYIGTRKFDCVMHLFKEVLQNSIDESINEKSCCNQIIVTVDCDKKIIKVADNGRGIPLGVLEKVCTVIQSSGKFNKDSKESAYGKGTSGLNGVGITAVNALSNYFKIKSYRDGKYKLCKFEFGHLVKTEEKEIDHESGTIVEFNPNEELIGHCSYDGNEFLNLCKLMSYLLTDLRIKCEVTSGGKTVKEKFHSKNGIMDLLNELVDEPIVKPVYLCAEDSDYFVEAAFTYATEDSCKLLKENNNTFIMSFANFCTTVDGGNHVTGLKQGLSNALMKYVKENIFTKKDSKLTLTGDDTRSGLVCVLNVRLVNAEFSGQIKAKLINEDITPFVNTSIRHELNKWIKKNESQAKKIGDWIRLSCRTRIKSSEEKKNVIKQSGAFNAFSKNKIKGLSLATGKPGNLELLIVEGKSASGGAIEARDIRTTEILELKGIPFNACDTTTSRALQNVELRSLVTAMGTGIGKEFDISKCRYKKIIIMSDADVDGHKITSLVSVFFLYHMPEIIKAGMLYKAVPPLYKIEEGRKPIYLNDNSDYAKYLTNFISNKNELYDLNGNKLSKKEISNLIERNRTYKNDVDKLSKYLICNNLLPELIALYYNDIKDGNIKKFKKELLKLSPFLKLNKEKDYYAIEGLMNKEVQYIRLDNSTMNKIKDLAKHISKYENGEIYYIMDGKKQSLYQIMDKFSTFEPNKQRFKGLGEMSPSELWETTMDPENRVLIRLTMDDIKKELDTFNLLHSQKCRIERSEMMAKFKLNLDDIDN